MPNAETEAPQSTTDDLSAPMNGISSHYQDLTPTTSTTKRDSRDTAPSSLGGGRFPLRKPPPSTTAGSNAAAAAGGSRVAGLIANMNAGGGEKVGNGNRDSVGSIGGGGTGAGGGEGTGTGTVERRGVSLEDKPMDD